MKYFRGILVVSLVFLLPLGSYLYLRSGFNFRKEALEILKDRSELDSESFAIIEEKASTFKDRYNKGVTLIQRVEDEVDLKDLYFFAENLQVRKDFHLVGLIENSKPELSSDTVFQKTLSRIPLRSTEIDRIMGEQRFILAKDSFVRNTYGVTVEDTKEVYEHAVILLPVKKRDKVKLQRKKEI